MYRHLPPYLLALGVLAFATHFSAAVAETAERRLADLKTLYERPANIPFPVNASYSPQIATLGKMLFFDPRLSSSSNMSCSSCHQPSFGWTTASEVAIGARGIPLDRASPPTLNLAWSKELFWDGRATSLEHQAAGPINNQQEMASTLEIITMRLFGIKYYRDWFSTLFTDGLTEDNVLTAIATYERTIVSGLSAFDRWVRGDEMAIGDAEKRGFLLFNDKMKCARCHKGWNFTDNLYHDVGNSGNDLGRYTVDHTNPQNRHAFKTPTLREINIRSPYMHNGSVPSLNAVVSHYMSGGIKRPSNSLKPISLTRAERDDLIAFLKSLSSNNLRVEVPILPN